MTAFKWFEITRICNYRKVIVKYGYEYRLKKMAMSTPMSKALIKTKTSR